MKPKPQSTINGRRGGRPRKAVAEKIPDKYGNVTVRYDPAQQTLINADTDTQALAMRLMLHFPEVATVQDLWAYALIRLARMTDD